MKTLILSIILFASCTICSGMGFPHVIADQQVAALGKPVRESVAIRAVVCYLSECPDEKPQATGQPSDRPDLPQPAASTTSPHQIVLKIFDGEGNLLQSEQIDIADFMNQAYLLKKLPAKSLFVLFHANTAYYFREEE